MADGQIGLDLNDRWPFQLQFQDFLLGGVLVHCGGGADLRCGHFLVETYAKMKELGLIEGGGTPVVPSSSANAFGTGLNGRGGQLKTK